MDMMDPKEMPDPSYGMNMANVMDSMYSPEPTEQKSTPPSSVDQEIRDMILKRKEASRTFYQPKKEIHDQCWNHYRQIYDKTNKESWQSTTFIPASPKVAEVIAANMHSALMGPDRPIEYQSRQAINDDKIRDVNDLIATDMEKSQFKVHWTDILRSICVIGTGVGKIEYKKEYADIKVKERVRELPMMAMARKMIGLPPSPTETTSIKKIIVKDFASLKYVDRYDVFPEPGSTEISKDTWIIERGKICNYKLIELMNDPDNPLVNVTDEVLSTSPKQLDSDGDKQEKDAALDELNKMTAYLDPDQEHELLEYWGPAPRWMVEPELYGDESRKYESVYAWFWLIDNQHVVRRQITPWRDAEPPYIKGVYIRVPGQWDGIGPLELMKGLQIELNESRNCRQDEVNLKLSKPVAVLKDYVDDWQRLKAGPGAIWTFKDIDDIHKVMMEMNYNLGLNDSWRTDAQIYNEIQEVTAATKATIGTGGGEDQSGGSTFRGQLLNKQTSSDRFIMYARILEITGLGDAIRKFYHRIYQYKDLESIQKALGPIRGMKFEFIAPEELDVMARLVPLGVTSMENKGVKLAQMAEQFKMFIGQPWFKAVEHARRMLVVGGDEPDVSIMSDEELQAYNQAKRALIGQDMGMGPQGPMPGQPPSPIAGGIPGPNDGQPMPAMPANGPGASPIDGFGRPAA